MAAPAAVAATAAAVAATAAAVAPTAAAVAAPAAPTGPKRDAGTAMRAGHLESGAGGGRRSGLRDGRATEQHRSGQHAGARRTDRGVADRTQ
jgi:hypothetical protein